MSLDQEQIESGKVASVTALAEHEGVDEAFVRRQLQLPFHPPRVIEALAQGGEGLESIKVAVKGEPGGAGGGEG